MMMRRWRWVPSWCWSSIGWRRRSSHVMRMVMMSTTIRRRRPSFGVAACRIGSGTTTTVGRGRRSVARTGAVSATPTAARLARCRGRRVHSSVRSARRPTGRRRTRARSVLRRRRMVHHGTGWIGVDRRHNDSFLVAFFEYK